MEEPEAGPVPEATESATLLSLPTDLGIESAAELQRELRNALDEDGEVVLDAQDVSRIHTAAVQLLCLFARDRRDAGHEFSWRGEPSEAMRAAANLLGATTLLSLARESAS